MRWKPHGILRCRICQRVVNKTNPNQKYCGSIKEKTGCAYKERMRRSVIYVTKQRVSGYIRPNKPPQRFFNIPNIPIIPIEKHKPKLMKPLELMPYLNI